MRKPKKTMVWPVYLDSLKTRGEGRKIPQKAAIPNPKLVELQRAAEQLGLKPEVDVQKAHPSTPWKKTGRLLIEKTKTKNLNLIDIAAKTASMRQKSKG
jgi:signal recognition particle subunit SRP19